MKRLLWLLLFAAATTIAVRAQTVAITSPSGTATSPVTITGTTSGFSASATGNLSVTVTNSSSVSTTLVTTVTGNTNWSVAWAPTVPGAYTLSAAFQSIASPTVAVTINGAPVVTSLSLLGGSASMPVGAARFVNVTAAAAGAIDHVELYLDAVLIGSSSTAASSSTYTFPFTAPTVTGLHQINAKVYDSAGNVGSSNFISIQVNTPIGNAPTVGVLTPASGAFLPTGIASTITGNVADTDGNITGVQVFANGLVIGNATITAGTWTIAWTPSAIGPVQLVALANDDKGNTSASPAVPVNVTDSTSPAITLGLSPNTASVPASTTLPSGATRNIVVTATPATGRAVVRVEFFVNGTKVGEKTTAPYSYRFTAPAATGTYVFSARATDNTGLARDAQTTFIVTSAVGAPPTVNLLTPTNGTTVVPNTAVSLASSALATGGTIASVQFYVNGSPALVNAGNAITANPYVSSFIPPTPGSYVIDAIATDDRGNTTTSNAVTITAAFGTPTVAITAPNANATARATPNIPLTITATATAGTGAGVLLVEFLLDGVQIGTKTSPTVTNGSSYSFAWTPTAAQIGTHQLTARVTDTNSQVATSTPAVNVSVANVVGTPPTVTIASPTGTAATAIQSLSTVNFVANAFASGTSTLSSVEFFLNDASIGLAAREQTTNLWRLAFNFGNYDFSSITPDVNGRYPLTLYAIAKDNNNNQTISTPVTLGVTPSTSAAPSVQLINALGTTTVTQGTAFFMLATPSDSDGTVVSLQLFVNGTASGAAIANPAAQTLVTYTPNTAGRYNLYVVATDDTGNTAVSSPSIVLNVTAITAPTTTLTLPADDSTVTTIGAPVFLQANAAGSDATQIPTVQFLVTSSGGTRTTINATRIGTTQTYRAVWTPTTADTFTIVSQATINGVSGQSTASRRAVVNNVVGIAPVITISFPASVTSVSTAVFNATATSASSGIIGVEFFVNRNSIGQAAREQQTNLWRINASFASLTPGSYEVVALARDGAGNVAASTTGTITVTAATTAAPVISIAVNPPTVAFSQPIALTANASSATGAISQVQYFVNGTSINTSTNAGTSYAVSLATGTNTSLPTNTAGTYNVYAVATDSAGNTAVSATIAVTVKRNNPILDIDAFILQTYTDITNTTANSVQLANYDAQLTAGTITRAQLVAALTTNNTNFTNVVNALAAYYVLMGQWPTTANYTTLFNQRGNLSTVCGTIIASPEYVVKYGLTPTVALLDNPASLLPEVTFLTRLYQNAGLGTPSALQLLQFKNNATAVTTTNPPVGRGYDGINPTSGNANGLNAALADFISVTNANNTALFDLATAAALYYQLDKPTVVTAAQALTATTPVVTQDAAAARITVLAALPDIATTADAVLKDVLYTYRYVTITAQPQSLTVNAKSGALFRVAAIGQPPLSYQWLFNGAPIAGATAPLLSITNVDTSKAGAYTCVVSSAVGTSTSDPATLTLSTALTKLLNISTRGTTAAGTQTLIAGFVVSGPANQTRQMLIRVIGPGLATQGLTAGVLADPRLELYGPTSTTTPIQTNDNWGTQTANATTNAAAVTAIQQAAQRVGAFALPNTNSLDAVVLATLAPGNYTVQAKGPTAAATGLVLIEVYDATPTSAATNPKAINVSTRGFVGTGANSMIAGFVITGQVSRRVLIRGVGPTLASFGLPAATLLATPQIELFDSTSTSLAVNSGWTTGDDAAVIASAAVAGGAFALANGGKDAALLRMLPPGAYTVQLTGVGSTTGIALVEVYDVDP
jgi:hypothetical protein